MFCVQTSHLFLLLLLLVPFTHSAPHPPPLSLLPVFTPNWSRSNRKRRNVSLNISTLLLLLRLREGLHRRRKGSAGNIRRGADKF